MQPGQGMTLGGPQGGVGTGAAVAAVIVTAPGAHAAAPCPGLAAGLDPIHLVGVGPQGVDIASVLI